MAGIGENDPPTARLNLLVEAHNETSALFLVSLACCLRAVPAERVPRADAHRRPRG